VFRDPQATSYLFTALTHHVQSTHSKIHVIAGLESRGFILGPQLAAALHCAFTPIRKAGKLPGETVKMTYTKEYGKDEIELQKSAIKPGDNVILVDDLLATGGSMWAAAELVKKAGGNVVEAIVVVELSSLNGRKKLGDIPTFSLLTYS